MTDILTAIENRSSTRGYTADKLSKDQLGALLRAGLQAPTAANRQEIHITVLDGEDPILAEIEAEKNKALDKVPTANFYYNAPTVLILSGDESFGWTPVDAGIAVENIALAAEGLGLGSLIIGCIKGALMGSARRNSPKSSSCRKGMPTRSPSPWGIRLLPRSRTLTIWPKM